VAPADDAIVPFNRAGLLRRHDWAIVTLLAGIGLFAGTYAVHAIERTGESAAYYQGEFGPAVLFACGRGLLSPALDVLRSTAGHEPPIAQFLLQRRPSLSCDELPAAVPTGPASTFQGSSRYLMLAVGLVWRMCGVSWDVVGWLSGALFGIAVALAYLAVRATAGVSISLLAAGLWATSNVHLTNVPHLRDYAKAPFFVLALGACAWVAAQSFARRPVWAGAVLVGAALGFGLGIRPDVLFYLWPVVIALLVFRPAPLDREWRTNVIACVLVLAGFGAVAAPVLRSYAGGNNFGHVALLGLSPASRGALDLGDAPYEILSQYDDTYAAAAIAAFKERRDGPGLPLLGSSEYDRVANAYYQSIVATFPGDAITRAIASSFGSLNLAFSPVALATPAAAGTTAGTFYRWRARLLWPFQGMGVVLFAAAMAMVMGRRVGAGLLVAMVVAFFTSLPALQYQPRHVFQLEFLTLWMFALTVGELVDACRASVGSRSWQPWTMRAALVVRGLPMAAALVAALWLSAVAARAYQQPRAAAVFTAYLDAPRRPLITTPHALDNRTVRIGEAAFSGDRAAPARAVESGAVLAEIGGAACDFDVVDATFRYRPTGRTGRDFSRSLRIPAVASPTFVFFPFYTSGPGWNDLDLRFTGIDVPRDQSSCVTNLWRVDTERLPLLVMATLADGWRGQPLHETINGWEPAPRRAHVAPAVYGAGVPLPLRHSEWAHLLSGGDFLPLKGAPTFLAPSAIVPAPGRVEVNGRAAGAGSYLVSWPETFVDRGRLLVAEGELDAGGITVGLTRDARWAAQLNIDVPGPFRVLIHVDEPAAYEPVVANHIAPTSVWRAVARRNRFSLTRIGWTSFASLASMPLER
jgi:hypothetical protein